MNIMCDYPGGNIIVKEIREAGGFTEVFLEQDIRDTDRWWFYWNFRVDNPQKGKVRFTFCNKDVVCPHGAAVSKDGVNWAYDEAGYEDGTHFSYTFDGGENVYFSFTLPYQVSHFENFFEKIKCDNRVKRSIFAVSEGGREMPLITFGEGKKDVIFTARHHACESTASYALEGVISAFLNEYRYLLEKYRFHIIPFIDIDGVENGDQGKSRRPHDHNLDYSDTPIYNATKAMYKYTESLDIQAFIDFHSPWKWGGADSRPHIHLMSYEGEVNTQTAFVDALVKITGKEGFGGIKYDGYVTHLGDPFNNPDSKCADCYFRNIHSTPFSFTIETPYSGDLKKGYSAELLREWGKNIAAAFARVLG